MKNIKLLFILTLGLLIYSCSRSSDEVVEQKPQTEENFEIIASKTENVQEFDVLDFSIIKPSSLSRIEVIWSANGKGFDFTKKYHRVTDMMGSIGIYKLKADILCVRPDSSRYTKSVFKDINVLAKPKHTVRIDSLGLYKYNRIDDFRIYNTYSYNTSFEIVERDNNYNEVVKYLSTINYDNTYFTDINYLKEMVWKVNSDFRAIVYKDGLNTKNFQIKVYGQNTKISKRLLKTFYVDLTRYREVKPRYIDLSDNEMDLVIAVTWE